MLTRSEGRGRGTSTPSIGCKAWSTGNERLNRGWDPRGKAGREEKCRTCGGSWENRVCVADEYHASGRPVTMKRLLKAAQPGKRTRFGGAPGEKGEAWRPMVPSWQRVERSRTTVSEFDLRQQGRISELSGELFAPLLSYLRTGKLVVTERDNIQLLYTEAEFYNLERLQKELRPHLNQYDNKDDKIVQISASGPTSNLSRMDVVRALMVSPSTQELRFQGMNFEGCDLSRLDLRNINFKMSNLRGANLSYANISGANFDRADLTDAVCDHAVLFGVKLPCAVMERCSLQNVNADDPAGSRANFENVNLRNARLDNSQLNGANFRVANLKFASMKNCELKQASFPGANLEQCDLSGSNLYEANLRGANLVDTNFGHLANALHMSQTI
ncbi:BTB/POZ domain-containing protein KCTD9-like isoform X2 [Paramacrobiotus metropolitanus]|uniref:BTB/POZ domain-containing protein KCTD9-like isoform X2 n=1 Tax=Paramacrobiotus metropolitanus TaxID=2943436 RepID=UPI0024459050|nr:BTB/POZ domain-containing protein KCTD9-like isoform X2 [Paramacrobiotus metropolitanus]